MNREDVFRGVCECLAAAIDVDREKIRPADRLVADLGADSLDLLDVTFHLEQRFKVSLSPRDMEKRVRAALGDIPLEVDGVYTPEALRELRKALPEVPPEEIAEGLTTAELPQRLRVVTMVNLICRLVEVDDE